MQNVRIIGISELVGAIGIIVHQQINILQILSPFEVVGITVILGLVSFQHIH